MRLSLDWLAEWIDLPPPPELEDRLNLGGFEDAVVEEVGSDLSGVRVGQVLERGRHPNADRLSVCRVDLGEGEPLEIVCGAPNVAAGQKVAVAVPGMVLPDGTKLKKSKIRGVRSAGMICSERELGLGDDQEGILVLGEDAPVGAPLSEVLGAGERILEVGITPNRGDTASLLGVAREVRALLGGELRVPETQPAAEEEEGVDWQELAAEGRQRIIRIPADRLRSGDNSYNIAVRHEDFIRLDPGPVGYFYLGGHVIRPGVYALQGHHGRNLMNDIDAHNRVVHKCKSLHRARRVLEACGRDRHVTDSHGRVLPALGHGADIESGNAPDQSLHVRRGARALLGLGRILRCQRHSSCGG